MSRPFKQPDPINPYMCEYCHKREATKQRETGLLVCDKCDKELTEHLKAVADGKTLGALFG